MSLYPWFTELSVNLHEKIFSVILSPSRDRKKICFFFVVKSASLSKQIVGSSVHYRIVLVQERQRQQGAGPTLTRFLEKAVKRTKQFALSLLHLCSFFYVYGDTYIVYTYQQQQKGRVRGRLCLAHQ